MQVVRWEMLEKDLEKNFYFCFLLSGLLYFIIYCGNL